MTPTTGRSASPDARWVLCLAIAVYLLYVCHRALVLRVAYFDEYSYLGNARAILGDPLGRYDMLRPPLLPLLELPVALIVRASAPGSLARIVAPHCLAALIALVAAGAVLWVFRLVFPPGFALLGTLLFVGSRYFVHYGAHALADILSAGCAAVTVGAYVVVRRRRALTGYALAGLAFGAALLAKFPLLGLAPALIVAEVWYTVRARRREPQRWLGLALLGVTGVALFAGVHMLALSMAFGRMGPGIFLSTFDPRALWVTVRIGGVHHGESWRDWLTLAPDMLGPMLALAAGGVGLALVQRQERDVPFLAWLVLLGGGIVFGIGHNEARYLLPVVPAIVYFAVRVVEAAIVRLGRHDLHAASLTAVRLGGVVLLASALAPGVRQVWRDRDPVFFADLQRRAALRMLARRAPQGRLVWSGGWRRTRFTAHSLVPRDETLGAFFFAPQMATYFIDQPVIRSRGLHGVPPAEVPFLPWLKDGDVVLSVEPHGAHPAPRPDVPELELWALRRMLLVRNGDRFVSVLDPRLSLDRGALGSGEYAIRAQADLGHWSVLTLRARPAVPRLLGEVVFQAGRPVSLGPGSADVDGLVLADVSREVIR